MSFWFFLVKKKEHYKPIKVVVNSCGDRKQQFYFRTFEKTQLMKYKGGQIRENLEVGTEVEVIQKYDQSSGALTWGIVKRILTKSPQHTHGIKVLLDSGKVGRVKNILTQEG